MPALSLSRRFRGSKVPAVDIGFWTLKLLTTAMGESTSDYLVHQMNPEIAVLLGAIGFVLAMWNQLRAPRYLIGAYWLAVVMVAVFGTMCADVVHVAFGVPYVVSTSAFALILATVFFSWSRFETTLSIHSITTTRRELFYWAAVCSTFALGTAAGDFAAYSLSLGYVRSAAVFLVLFSLPGLYFLFTRVHPIASFWFAYVLTRPLGASVADWLGKPPSVGGQGIGAGIVALVFLLAIVIGVALRQGQSRQLRH